MSETDLGRRSDIRSLISSIPFWGCHVVAAVGLVYWGWSWVGFGVALIFYYLRMFGITAGYHRYFAHRSYKTSRFFQFLLALLGTLAVQKGVLWWAAHHRAHHRYSDTEKDIHSPVQRGFWWSHLGWILTTRYEATDWSRIKDFSKYPELRFLNRFEFPIVIAFAVSLFLVGGLPLIFWGFVVSTVLLWHGTFCINSLAHLMGRRPYPTKDGSRNSMFLALITMGEGWHNNHHHYQYSARQGFLWWQIDMSYYILKLLSFAGIVWDLKPAPVREVKGA